MAAEIANGELPLLGVEQSRSTPMAFLFDEERGPVARQTHLIAGCGIGPEVRSPRLAGPAERRDAKFSPLSYAVFAFDNSRLPR